MIDLDRITHPLRLAGGSHERDSGKGCAMNVISYVNGDIEITDYPVCSARPLARLVQIVNDRSVGPDSYLSPKDALIALDLAWKTVGTADVPNQVVLRWLAEVLVDPQHGIAKLVSDDDDEMVAVQIRHIADAIVRAADRYPMSPDLYAPLGRAESAWKLGAGGDFRPRHHRTVLVGCIVSNAASAADIAARTAHDYVVGNKIIGSNRAREFVNFAFDATAFAGEEDTVTWSDWAIRRWRELAGLDDTPVNSITVDAALAEMTT